MAKQTINLGTTPSDGTGDPLRAALDKVNDNFDELYAANTSASAALAAHTQNTNNPHAVNADDVGLGNCDNTSDLDKPISTAAQTALDLKAPLASPNFSGSPKIAGNTIATLENIPNLSSYLQETDSIEDTTGINATIQSALDGKQAALTAASQAEMEAGTEAGARKMSPLNIAQAIAALAAADEDADITVFVDQVLGHDRLDGSSARAPVKTLARAVAVAGSNAVIGLRRGQIFRESLNVTTLTSPTVTAYGEGQPPVITGADIITAWSLVGGTSNVYQATITHDANSSNRLRVYEDDVRLTRVANQATCESTPGSFVIAVGSDGSPLTFKMHPTGSGNPTSNGKVYEVTVRTNGIAGGNGCIVRGIHTARCISNNGSADLVSRTNGLLEAVIGEDGSKHNLGIGSGTMRDCVAVRADTTTAAEPSNTQLVAYVENGTGMSVNIVRCGVIGPAPGVDFTAHGNPTGFDTVSAEQLWVVDTEAFTTGWTSNRGSYYRDVLGPPVGLGTSEMLLLDLSGGGSPVTPGNYTAEVLRDSVILKRQDTAGNEVFRPNGAYAVELAYSAFFCETSLSAGNPTFWFANGNSNQNINLHHSIVFNGHSMMRLATGGTYVGNYNVFIAGTPGETHQVIMLHHTAGWCVTLAAWQAATGQDAQSVWLRRSDQSRGDGNAFWLGLATNVNDGPVDGDWRINPNALVFSGGGGSFYGMFPDGTPLTQAGPRTHWNWMTRASASGPPTSWPTVPSSLEDARAYIAAPTAWRF